MFICCDGVVLVDVVVSIVAFRACGWQFLDLLDFVLVVIVVILLVVVVVKIVVLLVAAVVPAVFLMLLAVVGLFVVDCLLFIVGYLSYHQWCMGVVLCVSLFSTIEHS